jgi:hypothetical protein
MDMQSVQSLVCIDLLQHSTSTAQTINVFSLNLPNLVSIAQRWHHTDERCTTPSRELAKLPGYVKSVIFCGLDPSQSEKLVYATQLDLLFIQGRIHPSWTAPRDR